MPVSVDSGPNPLLDGLRIEPTPEPTALVIFGASGDLTRRKLLPAIYQLSRGQRLPARFAVLGVAKPDDVSSALARVLGYVDGEMDDPALYTRIMAKLTEMGCPDGVLFYLAI